MPDGMIASILKQHLRTDALLGIRGLPFVLDSPKQASFTPRGTETSTLPRDRRSACETVNKPKLRLLDEKQVKNCKRCELHAHRTQTVFGQGNPAARLVFVGEGPGFEEDKQGLAFVGPAGQLLTKMILAMGTTREEVYICNVVKCRPPGNRTPMAEEILACSPYLHEQLAIIKPEMIVALGAPAAKTLLNTAESIGKLRGRFHEYKIVHGPDAGETIPVMPTYHPAYLLRNPADKRFVWQDLQSVMASLGLTAPAAN